MTRVQHRGLVAVRKDLSALVEPENAGYTLSVMQMFHKSPLEGSVLKYEQPLAPVAEEDWEAVK